PGQPTLIGLHHGPLPVCPMPPCRLENAAAFLALLERYPQVRGVISGHNHCAVDEHHRGIQLLVTPSTYLYGEHPSGPQAPDPRRRAFRRLELYPDGTLVTDVIWDHG